MYILTSSINLNSDLIQSFLDAANVRVLRNAGRKIESGNGKKNNQNKKLVNGKTNKKKNKSAKRNKKNKNKSAKRNKNNINKSAKRNKNNKNKSAKRNKNNKNKSAKRNKKNKKKSAKKNKNKKYNRSAKSKNKKRNKSAKSKNKKNKKYMKTNKVSKGIEKKHKSGMRCLPSEPPTNEELNTIMKKNIRYKNYLKQLKRIINWIDLANKKMTKSSTFFNNTIRYYDY